jgi:hypothetical protein
VCAVLAGLAACGGSSTTHGNGRALAVAPTAHAAAAEQRDGDGDDDGSPGSSYDADDNEILAYRRAASASQLVTIAALVRRYLLAAASADGREACSLTYDLTDESAVEDYAQAHPSQPVAGCAQVMTEQLRGVHSKISVDAAKLDVVGARVGTRRGFALLGVGAHAERYLMLHRQLDAWKIDALVDSALP